MNGYLVGAGQLSGKHISSSIPKGVTKQLLYHQKNFRLRFAFFSAVMRNARANRIADREANGGDK